MEQKYLKTLGQIAVAGGAIVSIHGATTKSWKRAHTLFAGLGMAVWLLSKSRWVVRRIEGATPPQ